MANYVTCAQMKELERLTDESGLSYYQMMENAGSSAAKTIMDRERPCNVHVYCGKGNNGGDGFVVARILAKAGYAVRVFLVEGEPTTTDAITNCNLLKQMDVEIGPLVTDFVMIAAEDAEAHMSGKNPSVIVDAMYGTGFKGALRTNGLKAAKDINFCRSRGVKVYALDIPSGLGGDMTDEKDADPNAVNADLTITFHSMKPVHVQSFAEKYCGEIVVADIGIVGEIE